MEKCKKNEYEYVSVPADLQGQVGRAAGGSAGADRTEDHREARRRRRRLLGEFAVAAQRLYSNSIMRATDSQQPLLALNDDALILTFSF